MSDREQISDAITRMSRAINAPTEEAARLAVIAEVARNSMPEIDHVGISVAHRNGEVETRAATSELVRELDQLQYSLGEGPCLHAIEADPVVVVEDACNDTRWPRFVKAAAELGLRSQLGVRLYLDEHARGGFNLYSTSSDSIDSETRQLAELFASHAALAMGRVRAEENLNAALASRTTIGLALGIVMERYGMDQDRAFSYLTRIASTSETKLRAVAEHIVEEATERSRQG
ncbi:MAG TPA: GAF and ANTAR domain-containing protein [Nocardioides sp.]|nr:GAF and ANTAR domain-containing protein [Nocardioides sp.]